MGKNKSITTGYELPADLALKLKHLGLAVPLWDRPVTSAEIQYFLDRWPYLQLVSHNSREPYAQVQQVVAKSNWTILNYGDALTSSPGKFLFGGGDFRIPSEGEDGGGAVVNPGQGTIWNQAFNTAADMVALSQTLGWDGIHIIEGHPLMKWAAWMHALDDGLEVSGFEANEKDILRRERVKCSEIEDAKRLRLRA